MIMVVVVGGKLRMLFHLAHPALFQKVWEWMRFHKVECIWDLKAVPVLKVEFHSIENMQVSSTMQQGHGHEKCIGEILAYD